MAYAKVDSVEKRMGRTLSTSEKAVCQALLDDAAIIIDAFNENAQPDAKQLVSCRMVMRAMASGTASTVPMGATQGSMSGLGYSESWTIGSGGSAGEVYLSRLDKQVLGAGNKIGSYSPVQELAGDTIW